MNRDMRIAVILQMDVSVEMGKQPGESYARLGEHYNVARVRAGTNKSHL